MATAHRTARKHGYARKGRKGPEYRTWMAMRRRCHSPNDTYYADYGGRGITVCERWNSFANFLADIGPKPSPKHTIDRIDNDGNYEPGNCRWATPAEQARNTRKNRILAYGGMTMCVSEWAERLSIRPNLIHDRLKLGWTTEAALTTPTAAKGEHITFRGQTLTIREWEKHLGFRKSVVSSRLIRGWSVERALTQPQQVYSRHE